jgi:hypothetical protein
MNDGPLYFGCYGEAGHYLYCAVKGLLGRRNLSKTHDRKFSQAMKWTRVCDGILLPNDEAQIPGEGTWSFVRGYSIVSFWDRSGDDRGNSLSCFLVKGHHSFEEVLEIAKEAFPKLFSRFNFEIKDADLFGDKHAD